MPIDVPAPSILPGDDDILGYNIVVAAAIMSAQSNALLRAEARITMRQYVALRRLRAKPDLGSAELARHLFITPQSTGPLLDGLEQLGCITRVGAESPGQKMSVRLTAKGNSVVGDGDRLISQLEDDHRMQMGSAAVATLNTLLKDLIYTLRDPPKA